MDEMLSSIPQHMKNYQALLRKVSSWMKADALLFIHIFTHKDFAYHFEVRNLLHAQFHAEAWALNCRLVQ